MSTFQIPNKQGQTRNSGRTETGGEFLESFSVDINNPVGKIKSSRLLTKVLDETDLGNTDRVQALAVYRKSTESTTRYYVVSDDVVMKCLVSNDPTDNSKWSKETGINTSGFGDETDAVVFDDLLLISRSQDILSWNDTSDDNDWWTTVSKGGETGPSLKANYPHIMNVHRGGQETLFVTDKNEVHYANNTAGHSTVTLGTNLVACCVASGISATWVGTYSESDNNAYVYEIYVGEEVDSTPVARNAYKIDARAVLSIEVVDNIPYIFTEKGNLQAFNGAGFSTVERLPFSGTSFVLDNTRIGDIDDKNNFRPIHPKGMRAHNGSLFININTESENTGFSQNPYAKNTPSGIYEFNFETGQLHHRFGFAEVSIPAKLLDYSGPIMITDTPYTFLMAGADIEDTLAGLFVESDTQYGYIITPEINSGSIQDAYEAQYIKAKTLTGSDSIEFKYRIRLEDKSFFDYVLADEYTLNTTDSVSLSEGDEITIVDNTGAVGHVVSVSTGATVTSITVDSDMGTVGDSGTAEVINFTKLDDTYTSSDGEYKRLGVSENSPWIQYKLILNGDVELRQFISKSNSKTEL